MASILRINVSHGSILRLGVPPGVGDVYWALTKIEALRSRYHARAVHLLVQKTNLTRALDWSSLVDFVDATREHAFRPDTLCKGAGVSTRYSLMHACLWPNGVIDRGGHINDWLPELGPANLNFNIRYAEPTRPIGAVVYASSVGIHQAWTPNMGPEYWRELVDELTRQAGAPPTLIGKEWDQSFSDAVRARAVNLIGQTTLAQVAGILARAQVVVGIISGMTILANHFRTPCVAIHPVTPMNPRAWVADDAPYIPIAASKVPPASELARLAVSIMRRSASDQNGRAVPAVGT